MAAPQRVPYRSGSGLDRQAAARWIPRLPSLRQTCGHRASHTLLRHACTSEAILQSERCQLREEPVRRLIEIKSVLVQHNASLLYLVAGSLSSALCVHQMALLESERRAVGEHLVQVRDGIALWSLRLVLGVSDSQGLALLSVPDEIRTQPDCTSMVQVHALCLEHAAPAIRMERFAQGNADEVLEELVHIEKEAVDPQRADKVLDGCSVQNETGQVKRMVVASVKSSRMPGHSIPAPGHQRDFRESCPLVQQSTPYLTGHAGQPQQKISRRTQQPVLGDVRGELVVHDLDRQRGSEAPPNLLCLAHTATHNQCMRLGSPVTLEKPSPNGSVDLPLVGVRQRGKQITVLGDVHLAVPPAARVETVTEKEEQAGYRDLRNDPQGDGRGIGDLHDHSPNFAASPEHPPSYRIRIWGGIDNPRDGEGTANRMSEEVTRWSSVLDQLDDFAHVLSFPAAERKDARSAVSPYRFSMSMPSP